MIPPRELVEAVIRAESGGNPFAVSPAGAQGLMQVMPATAKSPGFGVKPLADPFDPEENRRFGTEYLGAMLRRYGGDREAALAAYNWGAGNADLWVKSGKRRDMLPAETRDYIDRIGGYLSGSAGSDTLAGSEGGGTMPSRIDMLLEAERRGILPPDQVEALNEARKRGLVPGSPQPESGSGAVRAFEAPSLGDVAGTINQFAYGFNESIGDVLDAPGRAASAIMSPLVDLVAGDARPGDPKPPELSSQIGLRGGAEPQTGPQRFVRRMGEEVGATVPFAAVPMAAALAPAGRPAASAAGRGGQALLQGIRNTPGRAATGELAATLGAGAGAATAREVAPGNRNAEMLAQLAGGVAPAVLANTPAALAARGARAISRRLSPAAQTRAAREHVGDILEPQMRAVQPELGEAERLRERIPGFDPSLAESTGAESLIATQRRMESQASGQELDQMAARRASNERAIERFAREQAPEAERPIEFAVDTATRQVRDLRAGIDRQKQATAGRERDFTDSFPPIDRTAEGGAIRSGINEEKRATSARMNRLAEDLGINDADVTVEFQAAARGIAEDFSPKSAFEDTTNYPRVLNTIKEFAEKPDAVVTFQDLKALRERVTDDLLDAQGRANPSRKEMRTLVALRERIDNIVDDLVESAEPDLAERYRQFRRAYFNDYVTRFERGRVYKVRRKDGRGDYRVPEERVGEAFFAPGEVEAARQFNAVLGNNPRSREALEAVALDSLRDFAVRDGALNEDLLRTWVRRHDSVLNEFPRLQTTVRDIEATKGRLQARQAQLDFRLKRVEDQALVRQLDAVERGTRTPEQVVQSAVRDPRLMMSLRQRLRKEPEALQALQRQVWDMASTGSGDDVLAFMDRHRPALRVVFGEQHLDNLRDIAIARGIVERLPRPTGRGIEPNPLEDLERGIGMGVPQLGSRIFAAQSGRTSYRYIATDAFGRFIRGRSVAESQALLKEALYNKDVARDLAQLTRMKQVKPEIANRLNAWLFNLGVTGEREEGQ